MLRIFLIVRDKGLLKFSLTFETSQVRFSFYYAHHKSTIEGGTVCTDDEEFYQYARMFRSHGMVRECNETYRQKFELPETYPEFTFPVAGFNMRSTELNAVIGLSQIKRLDVNNEKRKENFKVYLVDVVGFGKSSLPEEPLNSNDFA